ncbi:imm11 family protein [Polyangium fumosum]|uniref:Immunity MXAN-0049 protein domain-containing protein n=1 Tax=Polyangium fumosum TaxID=889272 RepID=A0A4U1JJA1_9BACT|nr:DUF1629 domain-containing protein [Polyangium fumosum]TKD12806.1 hypothetical protein E8A74_03405 [Polyangium fumosum]
MVIYEPLVATNYEWVNTIHSEDTEVFLQFDGTPRAATWKPIRVRRVRADKRQGFKPSDFPWLGSDALVMRRTAVDALRDILEANGEVLPLSTDDGVELYVLNARVIDALDEANSTLRRIPGTDRIMWIKKPAFFASAIEGIDLFRLPHRGSSTYVSERFVERVKAAGLRGLDFNVVWSG